MSKPPKPPNDAYKGNSRSYYTSNTTCKFIIVFFPVWVEVNRTVQRIITFIQHRNLSRDVLGIIIITRARIVCDGNVTGTFYFCCSIFFHSFLFSLQSTLRTYVGFFLVFFPLLFFFTSTVASSTLHILYLFLLLYLRTSELAVSYDDRDISCYFPFSFLICYCCVHREDGNMSRKFSTK